MKKVLMSFMCIVACVLPVGFVQALFFNSNQIFGYVIIFMVCVILPTGIVSMTIEEWRDL